MAQRFDNCLWVVITQYGKIGNLVGRPDLSTAVECVARARARERSDQHGPCGRRRAASQVHATRARPGTGGPDGGLYQLQVLLGRQEDSLPLVYARQVAEVIATAQDAASAGAASAPSEVLSASCPLLLGIAMRDTSPEAFRGVLAHLDAVRVW